MSNRITQLTELTGLIDGPNDDNYGIEVALTDDGFAVAATVSVNGDFQSLVYELDANGNLIGTVATSDIPANGGPERSESVEGMAVLTDGTIVAGFHTPRETSGKEPGLLIQSGSTTINKLITNDLSRRGIFKELDDMDVLALPDGGFAVLVGYELTGLLHRIDLIYYDANGNRVNRVDINTEFGLDPINRLGTVALSEDPDGGLAVMLGLDSTTSYTNGIGVIGRFSADGALIGQAQTFGADGDGIFDSADEDLAVLRDGRTVVVFKGEDPTPSGPGELYFRIMSADGTSLSDTVRISLGDSETAGPTGSASVIATRDGGFIVSWDIFSFQDGDVPEVNEAYMRRYDAQGNPVGPPMVIVPDDGVAGTWTGQAELVLRPDGTMLAAYNTLQGVPSVMMFRVEEIPSIYDDNVVGTSGADIESLLTGNDFYEGLGGNDVTSGNEGADTIFGGAGNDSAYGGSGKDSLYGGTGNDMLSGGTENDRLSAGDGNDRAYGGNGADVILGDVGQDSLHGDKGADSLFGGSGNDALFGGSENDRMLGGTGNDRGYGGSGADVVIGESGQDSLYGDSGTDSLYGGSGNDALSGGTETDQLFGDDGNDRGYGGAGNDLVYGGNGRDQMFGGTGTDFLFGGADSDTAYGDDGTDTVFGGSGDDFIFGGASSDRLRGDGGADRIEGGGGSDKIRGQGDADKLRGGQGADKIEGNRGSDNMQGNRGNDDLFGNKGNDKIYGNKGNDDVFGGKGNDKVFGGKGRDDVYGGNGNDKVFGGKGRDDLYGGAGADVFVFGKGDGKDKIHDFNLDRDAIRIDGVSNYSLSQENGNTVITYGNDDKITLKGIGLDDFSDSLIDLG